MILQETRYYSEPRIFVYGRNKKKLSPKEIYEIYKKCVDTYGPHIHTIMIEYKKLSEGPIVDAVTMNKEGRKEDFVRAHVIDVYYDKRRDPESQFFIESDSGAVIEDIDAYKKAFNEKNV